MCRALPIAREATKSESINTAMNVTAKLISSSNLHVIHITCNTPHMRMEQSIFLRSFSLIVARGSRERTGHAPTGRGSRRLTRGEEGKALG